MAKKRIKAFGEWVEDHLRRACGALSPDKRIIVILTLLLFFSVLSLYFTVSSIYRFGKGAGERMQIRHIERLELELRQRQEADSVKHTYTDKVSRNGLRVGDILHNFEEKYAAAKARHEQILKSLNYEYDITELEKQWMEGIEYLRQFNLVDSEHEINNLLKAGKSVLCEGAQGTMLDVDFGSYPFVTSSNTICAGACTGLGLGPNKIGEVYGIMKAYCTRVGAGPFPTELFDETGKTIRDLGHEYGAVTGRERRCGWVDLVALRYAIMVNGVTQLILMKSDVLDGFETIKACVAYKVNGEEIDYFPFDITEGVEPVYVEMPGWKTDMTKMTSEDEFPEEFNAYIAFLEEQLETPIKIVSVGPDRAQTIERYVED